MQRLSEDRAGLRRRGATVSWRRGESPAVTREPLNSALVTLAAGSPVAAIPSLLQVPSEYQHEVNAELLYALSAELVRKGSGTPELWSQCSGSAVKFAETSILRAVPESTLELLRRHVEYQFTISDRIDECRSAPRLEEGKLVVSVQCAACGYLALGTALEWLEAQQAGLAEAFYWTLLSSLYRTFRVYDHTDAQRYQDGMRESIEEDEESGETFEFPEVTKAIPPYIRDHIENAERKNFSARLRAYQRLHPLTWIEKLLRIHAISRLPIGSRSELKKSGYDDGPPLPTLLVAFRDNDAIVTCFDEESQYMLEATPEPALMVAFHLDHPDETAHAWRSVAHFVALNHALFELVEELQVWEQAHGSTGMHRSELSLSTS